MLKVELTKYPLEMEIIDDLLIFMIYHGIKTIYDLIIISDRRLLEMEGFKPQLLEAVHLLRGSALN